MSRVKNKLTAKKVETLKAPGYYSDGGSLYFQVSKSGSKSWIFRYTKDGKTTEMGLGAFVVVSLDDARRKADELRKQLHNGTDPLAEKRKQEYEAKLQKARIITFRQCGDAYIQEHQKAWKESHRKQWNQSLIQYAYPSLGDLSIADIDTNLVMQCLQPIWSNKTSTAVMLRGRIESILDWATVRQYRHGNNPAQWRGHLDKLLAAPTKIQKTEHHAAMPYVEINNFIERLREQDCITAICLEFLILTATRTNEAIGARWVDINLNDRIWTIPADKMKTGKEHRVTLNSQAMAILTKMSEFRINDFVFPGNREGLSIKSLYALIRRMDGKGFTTHGFRSTFRDWAAEQTAYPAEVIEMCLAHTTGNAVELAYKRTDLLEKRSRLMEEWGRFCNSPKVSGDVVAIRKTI